MNFYKKLVLILFLLLSNNSFAISSADIEEVKVIYYSELGNWIEKNGEKNIGDIDMQYHFKRSSKIFFTITTVTSESEYKVKDIGRIVYTSTLIQLKIAQIPHEVISFSCVNRRDCVALLKKSAEVDGYFNRKSIW